MRILIFDPLRAVLSWWVVAIHIAWLCGANVIGLGEIPVGGFIFISGLVITLLLSRGQETYGLFIARRALRLWPVFICCLGLTLLLRAICWPDLPQTHALAQTEHQFFMWHLGAHLSLLHGVVPDIFLPHAAQSLLPPAWSVSLEWQLYLIAPPLVWLVTRHRRWAYVLFGCSFIVFWSPLAWRLFKYWDEMGGFAPQKFYLFLGGALAARYAPTLARIKLPALSAPLSWLGAISYPTYLVHYPILVALVGLVPSREPWARACLLSFVGGPLIVLASAILHSCVERPWIALGKGFRVDARVLPVLNTAEKL
jgi:peptidoglycan/LPS O-acetylase OafA/YrhL